MSSEILAQNREKVLENAAQFWNAGMGTAPANLSEPNLVHRILRNCTTQFASNMQNLLGPYGLRFIANTGYIHQMPYIETKTTRVSYKCEPGDLLLILRVASPGGRFRTPR